MFDDPTFFVQIGFGGKPRLENALQEEYADGAILSPADYSKKKNKDLAQFTREREGLVLFDPQFYIPKTDRDDLNTYTYFESRGGEHFETGLVEDKAEREALCEDILSVQEYDLDVDAYISPARFLDTFSQLKLDRWLDLTETFMECAEEMDSSKPVFASLPIDGKQLNDEDYRNQLLNRVTSLDPHGFYVSVKYDYDTRYPLSGKQNVKSFLYLMRTLRENQYEVLVGHTHHIAHLLLAIGINGFATGHYKNLRAFDTNRWEPSDDESFGRQIVRYYSDHLLCDIRVDPDLEYIYQSDYDIDNIRMNSPWEVDLFDAGTSPEGSEWAFSNESWDHYIWACNYIKEQYTDEDLEERLQTAEDIISSAMGNYTDAESAVSTLNEEFDKLDISHLPVWKSSLDETKEEMRMNSIRLALR